VFNYQCANVAQHPFLRYSTPRLAPSERMVATLSEPCHECPCHGVPCGAVPCCAVSCGAILPIGDSAIALRRQGNGCRALPERDGPQRCVALRCVTLRYLTARYTWYIPISDWAFCPRHCSRWNTTQHNTTQRSTTQNGKRPEWLILLTLASARINSPTAPIDSSRFPILVISFGYRAGQVGLRRCTTIVIVPYLPFVRVGKTSIILYQIRNGAGLVLPRSWYPGIRDWSWKENKIKIRQFLSHFTVWRKNTCFTRRNSVLRPRQEALPLPIPIIRSVSTVK